MTVFRSAIQILSARLKSRKINVIKNVLEIKSGQLIFSKNCLGRINHEVD